MSRRSWINAGVVLVLIVAAAAAVLVRQLPSIAAGGLLYPSRQQAVRTAPAGCENREFAGDGVTLRGWYCRSAGPRRGTIVYLHGVADNRGSSTGAIERFTPKGLDVVAYDSRRHGLSDGEICTYGYYEKADLSRVIDTLPRGPVILFGTSLGAGVALQEAAGDRRVTGVIAAEVFSDLRTVAAERAPFFLSESTLRKAVQEAEERGSFKIDSVSPRKAAESITVPVLLIHGAEDAETPPSHSERVFDALAGPKRLLLVKGAGHNHSLSDPAVWAEIDAWMEALLRFGA